MSRGTIRDETGVATLQAIFALQNEVKLLKRMLSTAIRSGHLIAKHSDLDKLAYADAGHTGFASAASLSAHTSNVSNPHSVTAAQIGAPAIASAASEPATPTAAGFWYKPATGGVGGEWYFATEKGTGTWVWGGPVLRGRAT